MSTYLTGAGNGILSVRLCTLDYRGVRGRIRQCAGGYCIEAFVPIHEHDIQDVNGYDRSILRRCVHSNSKRTKFSAIKKKLLLHVMNPSHMLHN